MYGWNERASKAQVKHLIGGDRPKVVYEIGKYEVTIPGPELEVTYTVPYRQKTAPKDTLPNMIVADGEIRIDVAGLIDVILSRMQPVELARSLWQNDEVRQEFMDCLKDQWSQQGIGDDDRRKFLAGVKEAIHSSALDALSRRMSNLEYQFSRRASIYQTIGVIPRYVAAMQRDRRSSD